MKTNEMYDCIVYFWTMWLTYFINLQVHHCRECALVSHVYQTITYISTELESQT